jgi:hypothetical protein
MTGSNQTYQWAVGFTTRFSNLSRIGQFKRDDNIVAKEKRTTSRVKLSGSRLTGMVIG